jgi:hypothetical protein
MSPPCATPRATTTTSFYVFFAPWRLGEGNSGFPFAFIAIAGEGWDTLCGLYFRTAI